MSVFRCVCVCAPSAPAAMSSCVSHCMHRGVRTGSDPRLKSFPLSHEEADIAKMQYI